MQLAGNTVLITGGSSGIGYAMAEAFLEAGSKVAICARGEERLMEAHAKHPALRIRVCDVSREDDRKSLLTWVEQRLPDLNVLVNNAGIQRDIDFTRGIAEFLSGENEIRINLEAPVTLTGMLVPLLAMNRNPVLINVSSGLGFVYAAAMPVYSATKAGIHAFTMAMRLQLAKVGIKVFEVVPPPVNTNLNAEGRAKRGGYTPDLTAEDFVAAVMKDLEADVPEIGYGMTENFIRASRAELDRSFRQMNSRM
jgi:uncharacterized oxidoreductase